MDSVFVSDVHIAPGQHDRMESFIRFARYAVGIGADLYVVGDLFDYWLGPHHARADDYAPLLAGLRGVPLKFIWGNRDYLLDAHFARELGWEVLGREVWLDHGGRRVLVAHGDQILNENGKYAAYRRAVDLPGMRGVIRMLPLAIGRSLAKTYRRLSPATTPEVVWTEERMRRHVRPWFRRGADVVVCGHIHRPGHWTWPDGELLVLGDWREDGEIVIADEQGFRLSKRHR